MAKAKTGDSPPSPTAPAEYTVLARRYRPRQFLDLVGQEPVAQALVNALTSGRVAHAYLFTGARGVGKTSCARILAKALNCEKGPTPTPCDVCDRCVSIAAGDDVDVLEIDGASNNKVEEIRDLRSNVGFRPQRSRYKIYIIDEVHMLSNSAFNALLKTLEEPPPHVKFIFATTEVQKIPITILSRCQRFDFATIGPTKVYETLRQIVAKEQLQADEDALRIVARRANGSMRDAQTLLDQLLGFSGGRLTAARVHELLGTAGDERVGELATAIVAGDAARALALITEAADRGLQLGEFLDQLVDVWRGMMLVLAGGPKVSDLPGTPTLQETIRALSGKTTLDTVLAGLDILTTAKGRLKGSPHLQVLLEVAVVRLSRLEELLSVSQLAQVLTSGAALPSRPAAGPSEASKKNGSPEPPAPFRNVSPPASKPAESTGPEALTEDTMGHVWERVLQAVGIVRGAQLRLAGSPAILGPSSLVVRFPACYRAAYDACASEPSLEAIRIGLKRVTGTDWSIRVDREPEPEHPPETHERAPSTGGAVGRTKELLQLPFLRQAVEVLGAQLVRIDDGFDPRAAIPTRTDEAPASDVIDPDEG